MKNVKHAYAAVVRSDRDEAAPAPEEKKTAPRRVEEPYVLDKGHSVSFLGVEVPKGKGGRLTPTDAEFKEEYFYMEGHHTLMRDVATALLLNKPILLEGGTGVYNKTTTIARMCRDLNMNYCKVNFDRETAREDVIGGQTLKVDENGNESLEWYDGDLMYAIRNGGVAFLDEYNRQSKLAGIINPIIDAILNGRKEITNPYNENERVRVHPDFRLVAAQNPPGMEEGHEYTDRSQLPAETFGRWIYRKLPIEYTEAEENKLLAGVIGEEVGLELPETEFRSVGEGMPIRELAEIPGMTHWRREIITIIRVLEAKSSGAKRTMAKHQRQNLYFNPRLIMSTLPQYIARFYRGDINETVKNAFETCVIGMYSKEEDRQKIREMLNQAQWKPESSDSKRRGLERKGKPGVKAEEMMGELMSMASPAPAAPAEGSEPAEGKKRELSPEQADELIGKLKSRFGLPGNKKLRKAVDFANVVKSLRADPEALFSLSKLEETGGEPQVVGMVGDEFIFEDRSAESPKDRRSLSFDEADAQRKSFGPNVRFQSPDSYKTMQKTGKFDLNSWSWLETDPEKRKETGNAMYGYRYGVGVYVGGDGAGDRFPNYGWRAALRVKKLKL